MHYHQQRARYTLGTNYKEHIHIVGGTSDAIKHGTPSWSLYDIDNPLT